MAILDYALVTYHFAAQHFGALSLYRMRAERAGCAYTRRLDRIFALGVGGALVFLADILAGSAAYQDLWIGRWLVPAWLASKQGEIREVALVVLLVVAAVMLAAEARAPRRSLPRVLYILGLAAMVAVALQPRSPFLFFVIWTSQHWILATGLASQTPTGEPFPASGTVRRVFHSMNVRPWAILLVLVVFSVFLLPFFEVEANLDGGTYYGDRIFGAFAEGLRTSSWVPALVAAGFATGFVHYLLDRSVYRMSDPRIRSAARGLLDRPGKLAPLAQIDATTNATISQRLIAAPSRPQLRLGQPRAGTRTAFEDGEHIRQSEEILDRFVVIDQDELATGLMRRDVEANDRTQSGAVHSRDLFEIEDDSSGGWKQIPYVGV
jgi:hypothetical protein